MKVSKYKHIFFDLDHTLWDFNKNSVKAMEIVYTSIHCEAFEKVKFTDFYTIYKTFNDEMWAKYAKGLVTQDDIKFQRFQKTFLHYGVNDQLLMAEFSKMYIDILPEQTFLFPHCKEILTYLTNRSYKLHILSNGFEDVQLKKLTNTKIFSFFNTIITSERVGHPKPHRGIFEFALKQSGALKKESIMVGDSLDIDIKGALDFEMDCIHVNHLNKNLDPFANYTVFDLNELKDIL